MGQAVLDVLVICDCTVSKPLIGVREEEIWVFVEFLEGCVLVWEEVWGCSSMSEEFVDLCREVI